MVGSTYAIWWNGGHGARCAGRLHIDASNVVLTGARAGCRVHEEIPISEISSVQIKGRLLEIARRRGRSVSIGSLDAPGALRELAERLALLVI